MRLACLFVPLFPLAARLRSEPDLKGESVAVFEGNGNAARLVAATRKARQIGLEIGMTLPQARAILPKLVARGRDRETERAAQEALLEVADTFSPRVEDGGEGVVYLDLDGLPALSRGESSQLSAISSQPDQSPVTNSSSPDHKSQITNHKLSQSPEHLLGRSLIAAAEKVGLHARAGIAASKLAARVAAGLPDSPAVVPPGEEAAFLAPLPLSRLAPAFEIAQMLERWGLSSIGELARLPEGEVASRLGEAGRELHATARGIDPRPLEPRVSPPCFSEGMDLEWPLLSLEPFLFVGRAALERLLTRLESQALACTRLDLVLKLDPEGCDARSIDLPAPTRDGKTLLTLVRLELEARPPGAPVVGFVFTARPDRTRSAQLSLFGPTALSPDRLATTIARLASMLGADRLGSPRTTDGHRPERYAIASFAPPPPPPLARPLRSGRGLLSIRVLRPPVELEVIVDEALSSQLSALSQTEITRQPRSAPITNHKSPITNLSSPILNSQFSILNSSDRLLSIKTVSAEAQTKISGSVKVSAGPWRMEEGWWTSDPADRDYWDVELSDGALYRIYRDRASGAWYADGVYD